MKRIIRKARQKGVALVFALFTALLLMTLSTTVVGLSIRHARVGGEGDHIQEALHAVDWYLSAALSHLHFTQGALQCIQKGSYPNPYTDIVTIVDKTFNDGILGHSDVTANVTGLTLQQSEEYGLVCALHDLRQDVKNENPDEYKYFNGHLIRFGSHEPLVYFPHTGASPGAGFDPTSDRFAVCDVAVARIPPNLESCGTKGNPGLYHLRVVSRVYDATAWSTVKNVRTAGLEAYPTEGLLATRIVDVVAQAEGIGGSSFGGKTQELILRKIVPGGGGGWGGLFSPQGSPQVARSQGYLHVIQDGRSWRANGLNLDGRHSSLFHRFMSQTDTSEALELLQNGLMNCGFPEDYVERGKLRIDGGTRMQRSKDKIIRGERTYIDGSAQFFNSKSKNFAEFIGSMTQKWNADTMKFSNGEGSKYLDSVFSGGLDDEQDSIGLPQCGQNSNHVAVNKKDQEIGGFKEWQTEDGKTEYYRYKAYRERDTYQSFTRELATDAKTSGTSCCYYINGSIGAANTDASGVYVGSVSGNLVPDVYSTGSKEDVRPSFAKVVVTLGEGDRVTITKVNPKCKGKTTLYSGSASKIKNGIISVQGGNVEVCSETDSRGEAKAFTGNLTIVSDVEPSREDSLAYFGDKEGKNLQNGKSIYSDAARMYLHDNPEKVPPFKVSDIRRYADSQSPEWQESYKDPSLVEANDSAYVWPTPSSAATEREGNIYVTSDIKCGASNGKRGSVGIVAKNYIAFNDRTVEQKGKKPEDQTLNIEAMLFSFDQSVQFDWNNDAGNTTTNHEMLKRNADRREFNLVGSVVSSNLDIEGSAEGVGYLRQNERCNVSMDTPPPFIPAYSEVKTENCKYDEKTGKVISSGGGGEGGLGFSEWTNGAPWVIVSYVDCSARNWF